MKGRIDKLLESNHKLHIYIFICCIDHFVMCNNAGIKSFERKLACPVPCATMIPIPVEPRGSCFDTLLGLLLQAAPKIVVHTA